jgi:hypothetical protein
MSRLRALGLEVWDFVVGDDWRNAVAVIAALGITAILAGAGVAAWWVMPVAVPLLLWLSVRRVLRASR